MRFIDAENLLRVLSDDFKKMVISGRDLRPKDVVRLDKAIMTGDTIMMKDSRGMVLAVGEAEADAGSFTDTEFGEKLFTYVRVLN